MKFLLLPTLTGLTLAALLMHPAEAGWIPPEAKSVTEVEMAFSLTSPVEIRKVAQQFPGDSPLRALLLGRSASVEGIHAQAIRLTEAAVKALDLEPGLADPAAGETGPARWHAMSLYWLARCLLDAGKDAEHLATLERYRTLGYARFEEINQLKIAGVYFEISALLKRGEVSRAKALLMTVREGGLNTPPLKSTDAAALDLELMEAEGASVSELLKVNLDLSQQHRANGGDAGTDPLSTLAFYALRDGDFRQARQALEECGKRMNAKASFHPHRALAEMDLAAGDWDAAGRQLADCWKWQKTKRAGIRQELEKETLLTVANNYLARGYPADALRLTGPLLDNGVRGGFRSSRPEKWEAGLCLTTVAALRMQTTGTWDGALNLPSRFLLEERFRSCISVQLSGNQRKISFEDLMDCPDWLWGEAFRCLGPAMASRLMADYPPTGKLASAKLAAAQVEVAQLSGEASAVLRWAQPALDGLPNDCKLLRMRIHAARAAASWAMGDRGKALGDWELVMQEAPSMMPLTGSRLPVSFAGGLHDSRMVPHPDGLILELNAKAGEAALTLKTAGGKTLREAGVPSDKRGKWNFDGLFHPYNPLTSGGMEALEGR